MASSKKRSGGRRERGRLDHFECVDVNEVCYLADEELYQMLHDLIEVRERGLEVDADTRPVEVEFCYVRRELQIRNARREAHERYVRALQEENAILEQAVVMNTATEAN